MSGYCEACGLDRMWVEGSIKELAQLICDLEQKLARLESDIREELQMLRRKVYGKL